MNFLVQALKALCALHPQQFRLIWLSISAAARFWLIWISVTAASVIYVMSMVGQVATPSPKTRKRPISLILIWRQVGTPRAVVALMLLAVFLASYIVMILVWEDFAYYDNDLFIHYTLKGYNYTTPIWKDNGRFFPFGVQEFNLIRHFTSTPIGYHSLPIIQLLIVFCILLVLDAELSISARAGLAILALLTPSILISFNALIYPERNVIFLLACLVLSVKQFERTKAVAWAVTAVVCAQIMIYYKEVGFLLLLGFAAGRLVLRCRNSQRARLDYERLWDQESRLDLCLVFLAMMFLPTYFVVMGIHGNINYATGAHHPMPEVVLGYLRLDLLAWVFIAVVLGRIYLILRRRTVSWPSWDGLAFGGVAYFLAYLYLGMFSGYYLAPVDFIAVLYVGRIVLLSWKNAQSWDRLAALMLVFAIVLQDVWLSTFAAFERKNTIHAKAGIASVVRARYENVRKLPTLFFPFATPYVIMEFVVYLNYRGVPINSVASAKRSAAKDDRCTEYRNIKCHPASEPASGDLVVVLPDDEASLADALWYRERGQRLYSYEPRPSVPQWLYPLSISFPPNVPPNETRPDRWMDASVTIWK